LAAIEQTSRNGISQQAAEVGGRGRKRPHERLTSDNCSCYTAADAKQAYSTEVAA